MNRSRLLLVGILAPLLVSAAAVIAAVVLLPDLDRTLVVHWAVDGTPDGSAPAWVVLVSAGVLGIAVPMVVAISLLEHGENGLTANERVLGVTPLFVAGVLDGLLVWTFATQRDPSAPVPEVGPGLLVGFGAGILLAALAWLSLPKADARAARMPDPAPEPALRLASGERAVWVRRTVLARSARAGIALLVVLLLGAMIAAAVVTGGGLWWLLVVPAFILLFFAATAAWTVRVDGSGVVVRSALGWPAFTVRMAEIESAGIVTVSPIAQFGGWGIRWGAGRRFGVITRGGEALEVTVRGDRRFVVTVDDAATAAGLLTAVRAR